MSPIPSNLFGWHDDPVAIERTQLSVGIRPLMRSAPGLVGAVPDHDVMLYKAYKDVLGSYPNYPAQQIGDCTSFGHGHGHDLIQCVELSLAGGDSKGYRETCTEAIYGAGREAGGMLGSGDGCYGSAIVKGMQTIGMVSRESVGAYSGSRAKQWGRSGIPSEVRKAAADHRLGDAALVTTVDEAASAIANGYTVSICSNQGFEGRGGFHRDAAGICYAGGSWPHCMVMAGWICSDGRPSFVIFQSWGPTMPDGPQPFDLPPFAFRAESATVARILASKDSYALSKAAFFVARPLPAAWTNRGWAG